MDNVIRGFINKVAINPNMVKVLVEVLFFSFYLIYRVKLMKNMLLLFVNLMIN